MRGIHIGLTTHAAGAFFCLWCYRGELMNWEKGGYLPGQRGVKLTARFAFDGLLNID
jgi:hypothetical protein